MRIFTKLLLIMITQPTLNNLTLPMTMDLTTLTALMVLMTAHGTWVQKEN